MTGTNNSVSPSEGRSGSTCIQTRKVYGSCKDKECIEDLRVYLSGCSQEIVNDAISIKCRKAEIIWVYSDVEPVQFNRGYYTVDLRFFFKITLDVTCGASRPKQVEGIAVYEKKVILFGSEGNAKIFQSKYRFDEGDIQLWQKNNLPIAQVEVVDPICLGAKIVEPNDKSCCCCCCNCDISSIPSGICSAIDGCVVDNETDRKVFITLGIFTIVRLEREVQILIPVIDFCIPECECTTTGDSNPCELFNKLHFPVEEFFPPERDCFTGEPDVRNGCCQ